MQEARNKSEPHTPTEKQATRSVSLEKDAKDTFAQRLAEKKEVKKFGAASQRNGITSLFQFCHPFSRLPKISNLVNIKKNTIFILLHQKSLAHLDSNV